MTEDRERCASPLVDVMDRARGCLQGWSRSHKRTTVVTRTWSSGRPGVGSFEEDRLELCPWPRIRGAPRYVGAVQGTRTTGQRRVSGVSLRYTMADLAAYDLEPGQERWFEIEEEPGRVVQYRLAGDPEDMNSGWNFSLYRMHARPGADEP